MQVDPIKPTLKPPKTKLSKLKYDKPLTNFAFKCNLRRFSMALIALNCLLLAMYDPLSPEVGQCRLTPSNRR